MKNLSFLLIILLSSLSSMAQGVIKGVLTDAQSEMPLIGASVVLLDQEMTIGSVTDIDGRFMIENVPLGRQRISVSYTGYEPTTIPNIDVQAGKDIYLTISLSEAINELEEVVVRADASNKDRAINEMAAISTRQFSLEEVNRYSGGRGDVARLASNFAGVSTPDDSRNDIVIRGNSPTGVLWRIEGIPVPNPNHFSTLGTTGGPVSALNSNVLRNSDFMTSAFPAEYGNAVGGVFDLNFRKGNADRNEFMIQAGAFTGLEAMAEGPVGKNGGSYLVAGRYSFIGLIGAINNLTAATPNYRDIAFNLDLGNTKWGRFSFFGIGGNSDIDFLGSEIDSTDLFSAEDQDAFPRSNFGVLGMKHSIIFNNNTYLKTIIGATTSGNTYEEDRYFNMDTPQESKIRFAESSNQDVGFRINSFVNSKINARMTFRGGVLIENFRSDYSLSTRDEQPDLNGDGFPDVFTAYDFEGDFWLAQPYTQVRYRLTENIDINAGLHGMYSTLNDQIIAEPRASVKYQFAPKHAVTAAYGMHHQHAPLPLLFLENNEEGGNRANNEGLDFIRSQHYVLGYDYRISQDWRLKAELYYQDLDNVPVDKTPSSYSTLTEGSDFIFSFDKGNLVNEGSGYNAGVEVTLEKFFSKGYHVLFTASVFESKYTGSDGVERNTPFNNQYVLNVLGGKEWNLTPSGRTRLTVDTKFSTAGGRYVSPIDLEASQQAGFEVRREDLAFSEQQEAYFRMDLRLGLKLNSKNKRLSQHFFIDFQNVTNRDNIFLSRYNRLTNQVNTVYQAGFTPDFMYRLVF
jgi:hypothetical protein